MITQGFDLCKEAYHRKKDFIAVSCLEQIKNFHDRVQIGNRKKVGEWCIFINHKRVYSKYICIYLFFQKVLEREIRTGHKT